MTTESISLAVTIFLAIISAIVWLFAKFDKTKDKIHELERKIDKLEGKLEIYKVVTYNLKENSDIFVTLITNTLNNNEKRSRLQSPNGSQRKNKQ